MHLPEQTTHILMAYTQKNISPLSITAHIHRKEMQNDSNLTLYKQFCILSLCTLLHLLPEDKLPLEHCRMMGFPGLPLSASLPALIEKPNQKPGLMLSYKGLAVLQRSHGTGHLVKKQQQLLENYAEGFSTLVPPLPLFLGWIFKEMFVSCTLLSNWQFTAIKGSWLGIWGAVADEVALHSFKQEGSELCKRLYCKAAKGDTVVLWCSSKPRCNSVLTS